jgi:hypothetical protein
VGIGHGNRGIWKKCDHPIENRLRIELSLRNHGMTSGKSVLTAGKHPRLQDLSDTNEIGDYLCARKLLIDITSRVTSALLRSAGRPTGSGWRSGADSPGGD